MTRARLLKTTIFAKRCSCTRCAATALPATAPASKQSMSLERQRGLRGCLANLSLTSLEREGGRRKESEKEREREANWIYIFVFNPPYTLHWSYSSTLFRLHVQPRKKNKNKQTKLQRLHGGKSIQFIFLCHQRNCGLCCLEHNKWQACDFTAIIVGPLFRPRCHFVSAPELQFDAGFLVGAAGNNHNHNESKSIILFSIEI